jgi:hypothetical protein
LKARQDGNNSRHISIATAQLVRTARIGFWNTGRPARHVARLAGHVGAGEELGEGHGSQVDIGGGQREQRCAGEGDGEAHCVGVLVGEALDLKMKKCVGRVTAFSVEESNRSGVCWWG